MTPDEEGFFRTILDHPDDDTPRLVYADWLEERGRSERAEYIRVQIEVAKLADDDPRIATLLRRADELFPRFFEDYNRFRSAFEALTLRRGFVVRAQLGYANQLRVFLGQAHRFFDLGPVGHLVIEGEYEFLRGRSSLRTEDVERLVNLPQMSLVKKLTIGPIDRLGADAVAASSCLHRLERLRIVSSKFGRATVVKLRKRFGKSVSFS
jgi:uncharacterized protein (TIGR02996 family)